MLTFILIILLIIILPFCWHKAVHDLARADRTYTTITRTSRPDKNSKPPITTD